MDNFLWLFGMLPLVAATSWVAWAISCRRNGLHPRKEASAMTREAAARLRPALIVLGDRIIEFGTILQKAGPPRR